MENRKPIKKKTCRLCRGKFTPIRTTQVICSPRCAILYEAKKREKADKSRSKAHRREKKEYYDNHRPTQLKKAQEAFNGFIRERDRAMPCISCGKVAGGQFHAGHYRSVGAAPNLRFNQLNAMRQCAPCNNHKSGNAIQYRQGLIDRIGVEHVERIEADNEPRKPSLEDLKAITVYYRKRLKWLEEDEDGM